MPRCRVHHRMTEIGRDRCRSTCPTPLFRRATYSPLMGTTQPENRNALSRLLSDVYQFSERAETRLCIFSDSVEAATEKYTDFLHVLMLIGQEGNGFTLKERKFKSDLRRELFTERAVRRWHCCPESCGAPCLEVLKAWSDGQPQLVEALPIAGAGAGWSLRSFPNHSVIL